MIHLMGHQLVGPVLGQGNTRTYHELQPMFSLNEIWQAGLVGLVIVLIGVFVVWMYRRDSVELPSGIRRC